MANSTETLVWKRCPSEYDHTGRKKRKQPNMDTSPEKVYKVNPAWQGKEKTKPSRKDAYSEGEGKSA